MQTAARDDSGREHGRRSASLWERLFCCCWTTRSRPVELRAVGGGRPAGWPAGADSRSLRQPAEELHADPAALRRDAGVDDLEVGGEAGAEAAAVEEPVELAGEGVGERT